MKVRLLVQRAGERFSQHPGDVIEIEEAEATRLLAAGQAEAIAEEQPIESAAIAAQRTATREQPQFRKDRR